MNIQTKPRKELITFIIIIISTIIFILGLILFSNNYQKIYHTPILKDGVLDLKKYNINERKIDYNLSGEWEFFYNQWIITDKEKKQTGMIKLPARWNERFAISKKGYASYRIKIINPNLGDEYKIILNNFRGSYRAFINEKLVTECGKLSKSKEDNFAKGRPLYQNPYCTTEKAELELVIEIGYNEFGGFYSSPWLSTGSFSEKRSNLGNSIVSLVLFMMGTMFCLCVMSLTLNIGIYKKESLIYFLLMLVALFANQITSKDGCLILTRFDSSLDYNIYANLNLISIGIVFIIYLYFLKKEKIIKINLLSIIIPTIIIIFLFLWTFGSSYLYIIPLSLFALFQYVIIFKICQDSKKTFKERFFYYLLATGLFLIFTIELFDGLGIIVFGTEGIISFILNIIMISVMIFNYIKIKNITKENISIIEIENELKITKEKNLRAQIKPHFIFNTLTCIQDLYHNDISQGDYALNIFSKHLRAKVDSQKEELITFEEELDNVQSYFQLENLRYGNIINLYFDINSVDFKLPILSLQPFVKNSIKHGKLIEKDDGWIQISSYQDDNEVVIKIIDNGCGFSLNDVRTNSTGIKNCQERLKILLNASVEIKSVIDKGTIVEIRFSKN